MLLSSWMCTEKLNCSILCMLFLMFSKTTTLLSIVMGKASLLCPSILVPIPELKINYLVFPFDSGRSDGEYGHTLGALVLFPRASFRHHIFFVLLLVKWKCKGNSWTSVTTAGFYLVSLMKEQKILIVSFAHCLDIASHLIKYPKVIEYLCVSGAWWT